MKGENANDRPASNDTKLGERPYCVGSQILR